MAQWSYLTLAVFAPTVLRLEITEQLKWFGLLTANYGTYWNENGVLTPDGEREVEKIKDKMGSFVKKEARARIKLEALRRCYDEYKSLMRSLRSEVAQGGAGPHAIAHGIANGPQALGHGVALCAPGAVGVQIGAPAAVGSRIGSNIFAGPNGSVSMQSQYRHDDINDTDLL